MNEPKNTNELTQDQLGPALNLLNERTRVRVRVPGFTAEFVTMTLLVKENVLEIEVRV